MQRLVNWYWEYGCKRGYALNDPDRELRKISIGTWLDPLVRIIDRNKAIHSNSAGKACLALWGPSQTGKSTMMSQYVDGDSMDGVDSALTWNDTQKTRFSPPEEGVDMLQNICPDTLIFNPFNQQSDASGVATRYTLQEASSGTVNPDFPIEIIFTTRSQIIQSLALGYLSECERIGEDFNYTQESFSEEISSFETGEKATPEAYLLLKDLANVIEFMKGNRRFSNLFKNEAWDKKIRRQLVSAPALLSSKKNVEKFMAKILWDSATELTDFYQKAEKLSNDLRKEWGAQKILATMEVGALLLDIDSYKSYCQPDGNRGTHTKDKVSRLSYEIKGSSVYISLGTTTGAPVISGDNFGFFQAICAELVVPLKKEALMSSPSKNVFMKLAEKCDVLDFPGVSNKNTGNNTSDGNAVQVNLKKASVSEIFTKVFKQGKTQCFVYNYVKKYGIDAFSILVRTDRYPSQSSLLNSGIGEWVRSFSPSWKPGLSSEMPVFVNMTFFASLINNIQMNGIGNGLAPVIDRIQGELQFARKESAHFFTTTYPQFPDGKIDNPSGQNTTVNAILSDDMFAKSTGLTKENLDAVYSSDGGLDFMFESISATIDSTRRKGRCRGLLEKDKDEFLRIVTSQLPSGDDANFDKRKAGLLECQSIISELIAKIQENDNTQAFCDFANDLKKLFTAGSSVFDPIPVNANSKTKKELKEFIKAQTGKWYDYKVANLERSDYLTTEQQQTILLALRDSIETEPLFQLIRTQLGQITDRIMGESARYPFSLAFGNMLQKGVTMVESDAVVGECNPLVLDKFIQAEIEKDSDKDGSPYFYAILAPVFNRLGKLADTAKAGTRPPQEGDKELAVIYSDIISSNVFQI